MESARGLQMHEVARVHWFQCIITLERKYFPLAYVCILIAEE